MVKLMFLDYRDHEIVRGFDRRLEPPRKYRGNPILVSDQPWEGQRISLYGSVIRRPSDGLWQMWYTTAPGLAYAESDDGVRWRRPALDIVRVKRRRTNIVFDRSPHGACVIYDEREERPGRRYKMLAGAAPSHRISAFRSADGIHWQPAAENPVIGSNPDCPMSLHRARDGRFVAYHRPSFGDRRVGRSESYDFVHWSEPKMVLDQEPADDPQTQFYGMGSIPYGAYEIGTLWIYHTDVRDMRFYKMHGHQETELTYTRSGYAWHRAAPGTAWIRLGRKGSWEWGNIQAASAPVLLDDEIRFYYAATRTEHGQRVWKGKQPRCGIGFASMKPDRFVGVHADGEGLILTRPFWTETPEFFLNAAVRRGGDVRVEVTDLEARPIPGFEMRNCVPLTGDGLRLRVAWRGEPDRSPLVFRDIRLRVRARDATLYSLATGAEAEVRTYRDFRIPYFLNMERER